MAKKKEASKKVQYLGTGRRKTSVARVRLIPGGEGQIIINKKAINDYFTTDIQQIIVKQPLELVSATDKFDIFVNVYGGGITGQAGAIRLGIARALVLADEVSIARRESTHERFTVIRYFMPKPRAEE